MGNNNEELKRNRDEVIEIVFKKVYRKGADEVPFTMDDVRATTCKNPTAPIRYLG